MACGSLILDQKPSRLMMRERGDRRGDLNLDDAYDELFRLLECLLHPIRSLEPAHSYYSDAVTLLARGDWAIKATALVYLLYLARAIHKRHIKQD